MKKLIISSDLLKAALKKCGEAINPKGQLPVLRNIYCKVTKGQVELITTDRELTISVKCEAETEADPFEMLLPFDFINNIVAFIKSAPVTIEHPSTRKARILGENDHYELNSLDKLEEFPNLPAIPKKGNFRLNDQFVKTLNLAMLTVSKNEMMPHITKACLDMRKTEAFVVSTDTHFMFRYKIPLETEEPCQLLISPKTAHALNGMNDLEVSWTTKTVAFKSDKVCVWQQRYDAVFPKYDVVIPTYESNLQVEKDGMVEALKKACITSDESKKVILLLKKEKGSIHFDVDDVDASRKINVHIPGEYTGETEMVGLNAKKVLTVLSQLDGKSANLHIHNPNKAVLVSSPDDPNYLGLVMPLLIDTKAK